MISINRKNMYSGLNVWHVDIQEQQNTLGNDLTLQAEFALLLIEATNVTPDKVYLDKLPMQPTNY